ncbi:MAG: DUF6262 family protein [Acidimicrobiales bacterium]
MRADNTAHLANAARARTEEARKRATTAIRRLDRDGGDISVGAVARAANVSRSFLYRHGDLLAEIDRLRRAQPARSGPRLPSALRATDESRHAQAEALRAEIRRLTDENRWLREQAELLLGERRATPHQPGRTS